MESRYSEQEAADFCSRFSDVNEDIALRVYTSRLIGSDPSLVMHGGGNTSVKSTFTTVLGTELPALFVKGSGWNLDAIAPAGLPGLDLEYLKTLRALDSLGDTEMVNQLRTHLFDASSPNPSVETLLHAFLPHKFVDHSHADAILAITNRPDGEALVREIFGGRIGIVPYVMPGFELAKVCANVYEAGPEVDGLILLNHGLFTFGDTAKISYERHIELVTMAEDWLAGERENSGESLTRQEQAENPSELCARVAPVLRKLLAEATGDADHPFKSLVMDWRCSDEVMDFVNCAEFAELAETGPLTPDHVIRTKAYPLIVPEPDWGNIEEQLTSAVTTYRKLYNEYFDRMVDAKNVERTRLDDFPRVVMIPGVGALCWGKSAKDARVAGDITDHSIAVKSMVHLTGQYSALSDEHLFDVEYWPLEQAKLGKGGENPLARKVALVTGAAGAIGSAVAEVLIEQGAHVVLTDINADALTTTCNELAERHGKDCRRGVVCDITDESSVKDLFAEAVRQYGGLDIIVPNAGIAHSESLIDLNTDDWQRVQDVNVTGTLLVMQKAASLLTRQGLGGHIIVMGSKNVAAPGAQFSAYSASKAAVHQLAKVSAMELAAHGIRVNVLAPDAVFGEGEHASGLWGEVGPGRAEAHGIEFQKLEEHYRNRNLLKARVTGRHVGNAVVFFATSQTPTTGATLPIDGGISGAFSR
ncbi:MAG: bifunctional aldolase/short-chain dehydrogenase [Planctomycetota bacterium]|jgi:rhamnulose-1-phosphate aldolase/alcohol dehydrogenase